MASKGTSMAQHHGCWSQSQAQLQTHAVRRFRTLPVCHASKDEIMARIARAKQYKEPSEAPESASAAVPQPPSPPPSASPQQASAGSWLGMLGFAEEDAPPQQEESQETEKREWTTGKYIPVPEMSELYKTAPKRTGTGNDAEAADWLKGVLSDKGPALDANMRMEEFTEAKEQMMRQRGADIITIDPNYRPDLTGYSTESESAGTSTEGAESTDSSEQEGGSKYKPKVTTWGVFPRPKDISKTFGGGRNLQPGQALETKEQAAARNKEYEAMLSKYKKSIGAEIDPVDKAKAEQLLAQGVALFDDGRLQESITKLDQVLELMVLRSELGGRATLQKALALDSLGKNKEAEVLYKTIRRHPTAAVAKKAQQLYFGFEAQNFLRTDRLNYGVKKEDYMKYFRQFADRNKVWVASEEDKLQDEQTARLSVLVSVMVLGTPLALAVVLAVTGHH